MKKIQNNDIEKISIRVNKEQGEPVRKWLLDNGYLDINLQISREKDFLYFPISTDNHDIENLLQHEFPDKSINSFIHKFTSIQRSSGDYRDHLDNFPRLLLPLLPSSFDIIGNILILKIREELTEWADMIADALLNAHTHISSIYQDTGVDGTYRIRKIHYLAGKQDTVTIHKEYGMRFKIDIASVYFTPRLANERYRISQLTGRNEKVLDMFAGVGPFSISIAKEREDSTIYAIDQNPEAYKLMKENITLNKIHNITPIHGDSKIVVQDLSKETTFDRIIMNLPHNSLEFIDHAINSMDSGSIHIYDIVDREMIPSHIEFIRKRVTSGNKVIKQLETKEIKGYSPVEGFFVHDLMVKK